MLHVPSDRHERVKKDAAGELVALSVLVGGSWPTVGDDRLESDRA